MGVARWLYCGDHAACAMAEDFLRHHPGLSPLVVSDIQLTGDGENESNTRANVHPQPRIQVRCEGSVVIIH